MRNRKNRVKDGIPCSVIFNCIVLYGVDYLLILLASQLIGQ